MDNLKAGDVVVLKSGSKPMTISFINDEQAFCMYFDFKENSIKSESIYVDALKKE